MALRVSLVAMPWALADRPSIQLATLKAYLHQQFPGTVRVRAHHPYLDIAAALGTSLYREIAERSWLGEALYAPLLFPELRAAAEKLAQRQWRKGGRFPFDQVTRTLETRHRNSRHLEMLAESDLVGFSVCFAQLGASLVLAKWLKQLNPEAAVVFGGSMVSQALGRSLLHAFPQIDFVVNGEGEEPCARLVDLFKSGQDPADASIPGLFYRRAGEPVGGTGRRQISDLDSLPLPDYRDFFRDLQASPELAHTIVQLPVETSRGCWWHRATAEHPEKACQFCNLNLQWRGYRAKSPQRAASEIATLTRRHRSLRVALVDNTLPPSADRMFEEIEQIGRSLHLFAELRVPFTEQQVRRMRLAGLQQVQVGIEALSTRLLTRMGKGTRTIDNIAAMKWCEQFGIRNLSNLLLEFPGSDREDVEETLRALDFVMPFQSLRPVRFWLGEGSPVNSKPQAHGLWGVRNHRWYRALFPTELVSELTLTVKDYRGDQTRQRQLWLPVRRKIARWAKEYRMVKGKHPLAPILGYSDGGDFLIVRRRGSGTGVRGAFRLAGRSRAIYLMCREPCEWAGLKARFNSLKERQLLDFLDDLVEKRIMFRERDWYLSLAVDEDIRRFCPNSEG